MRGVRGMARALVVCALLAAVGCGGGKEKEPPASPSSLELTGTVLSIKDQTPVDGGVTIELQSTTRGKVILGFESLFTNPPPTAERQALYQDIRKVGVGDVVSVTARAQGATPYLLDRISVIEDHSPGN